MQLWNKLSSKTHTVPYSIGRYNIITKNIIIVRQIFSREEIFVLRVTRVANQNHWQSRDFSSKFFHRSASNEFQLEIVTSFVEFFRIDSAEKLANLRERERERRRIITALSEVFFQSLIREEIRYMINSIEEN